MKQYPEDIGMTIACNRCGNKQNFYLDTHNGTKEGYMVGRCSNCSVMISAKVYSNDKTIIYERGINPYDV
jgi:DNA-directed RNA polymerase subunit RPC12/RpoP